MDMVALLNMFPLYHTKFEINSTPKSITIDVDTILNRINLNKIKVFKRAPKIKRNQLIVKMGWLPETIWTHIIVDKLRSIVKPALKEICARKQHNLYVFNLMNLEFLLGKKWYVQRIPLKGSTLTEGYVLAVDLVGVRLTWNRTTEGFRIAIPIRYVNHAGYRQFG
eukprot:TRINITY_DN766_c0_g3_i3.p1 TRINITY_DN766_c0_g3~~TRINITY_DN766_c0_g3_i3.p1  ORF type:complete len:166 (-),score=6.44 TRINITY_DN766_c0_g3_i3:47-544(-)